MRMSVEGVIHFPPLRPVRGSIGGSIKHLYGFRWPLRCLEVLGPGRETVVVKMRYPFLASKQRRVLYTGFVDVIETVFQNRQRRRWCTAPRARTDFDDYEEGNYDTGCARSQQRYCERRKVGTRRRCVCCAGRNGRYRLKSGADSVHRWGR